VRPTAIDLLLLLMAVIWGSNYSIVKHVFREIDPQAFNAVRMTVASLAFAALMLAVRSGPVGQAARAGAFASVLRTPARLTGREWASLAVLGLVGHCAYQYCFMAGLARTSVANSSLLIAATPVLVALTSAALGFERIGPLHWVGAVLSLAGIYLVVGNGSGAAGSSLSGDLLMALAVCCWAAYTVGAAPLMQRHSPVGVTGLSMLLGTAVYVPLAWPSLRRVAWAAVSAQTWLWLLYSALFSICLAYTIWYAAVRQLGAARTAVYSNLVPVVAMVIAVVFLGEAVGPAKIAGAAAVIGGVALTRVRREGGGG
jgi:drug/metabolite transporter (DMT)-like permease